MEDLKELKQWVVHKNKVPYQPLVGRLQPASTTDPEHWNTFAVAETALGSGKYDGLGFVFKKGGGIIGVDLDGCRDPKTGVIAEWAQGVMGQFDSYTEVSFSGTGVHIFLKGILPVDSSGWKKHLNHPEIIPGKKPAIEIYQHSRFFTFTGREV